jgi:hypothetical protein
VWEAVAQLRFREGMEVAQDDDLSTKERRHTAEEGTGTLFL